MKKNYVFIFLILPVMLVVTAMALKYARGPYYVCADTEQDYVYLVSSLAMAESKQVFYTDHPGTTLQILGSAVLKIAHALDLSAKDSLSFAVLRNPEFYLTVINGVLISLNAILLFMIGRVTFNLTRSVGLGLLLQFSPFFSGIPLRWGLPQVSCEPLLMSVSLLLVLILIKMVFSENLSKSAHRYMLALAFVSGFGIATKVTFLPLLIIPFLALPDLRNRIWFLLLTGLSAIIWTWPITSQYERIFQRLGLILTHTGNYGHGSSGIIDFPSLQNVFLNILSGFMDDPLLPLIFFFAVCVLLIYLGFSKARKTAWQDTSFRILVALIAAQLFTLLIVVKQNCERYALPVLCLSGFLLFLIFIGLQRRNYFSRFDNKKITAVIVVFLILCGAWRLVDMKNLFNDYMQVKQESSAMSRKVENGYKDYLKIVYYMTPSSVAALSHGNYYTSHKYLSISEMETRLFSKGIYSETLQKIYGETYFYNPWNGEFYTWTKGFLIEDMISQRYGNKIVFYGPPIFRRNNDVMPCMTGSVLQLQDVGGGVFDTIYVLQGIRLPGK